MFWLLSRSQGHNILTLIFNLNLFCFLKKYVALIFTFNSTLFIIPYLSIMTIGSVINCEFKLINSAVSEVILKQIKILIRIKFINKYYTTAVYTLQLFGQFQLYFFLLTYFPLFKNNLGKS